MGKVVGKVVVLDVWSFNREAIMELDSIVSLVDVVIVVCCLSSQVPGVEFVCSIDPAKLLVSGELGRVAVICSWVSDTDFLPVVGELLGSGAAM